MIHMYIMLIVFVHKEEEKSQIIFVFIFFFFPLYCPNTGGHKFNIQQSFLQLFTYMYVHLNLMKM